MSASPSDRSPAIVLRLTPMLKRRADREHYVRPVKRAREPYEIRRQIVGRIGMAAFLILVAWIAWTRVINAPTGNL